MNVIIGRAGEKIAIDYLLKNNYQIIKKNFTCRWGEIDIIAKKGDILYFIEVKTRRSLKYGFPEESVNYFKLNSLKRAVNFFLKKNKIKAKMKLGVISINLNNRLTPQKINFYNIDNFSLN